ncbi:hypothetical protein B7R22_09265 [Subtercola boreus]|uniref:Uncharacterized protein n=1 Tax=Subtercola boreus TaxID=120213 RepID=A0A3E0VYK5_9MICO|nr:hypothetical protein [Subtercola boreus]RFA14418.1 hypothetical protein B7R22_09265 [Subtercola boreus]
MKRRRLPLWRWDPFLAALVLTLSLVAALFQRLDLPVVSPLALTVLLLAAVAAAVLLVLPVFVRSLRRDGEGSFVLTDQLRLVPLPATQTFPVVDGHRHKASVEATVARAGTEVTAVLVPGATAWLGRDIRVSVDALAGGKVYRVGYLPKEIDQKIDAALRPLAARGVYRTVALTIREVPVALRVSPFSTRDMPLEPRRKNYRLDVRLGPALSTVPESDESIDVSEAPEG